MQTMKIMTQATSTSIPVTERERIVMRLASSPWLVMFLVQGCTKRLILGCVKWDEKVAFC